MAVVITVSTSEPSPGRTIKVEGTGLTPNATTTVLLDGVGYTTSRFTCGPDGTFKVGRKVSGQVKYQSLQVQQVSGSIWIDAGLPIEIHVGGVVVVPVPSPAVAPDPPVGLAGTAGDTVVDLSWSAPVDDGGSDIIDYQPYKDGVSLGSAIVAPTTAKHVTGLTNTTSYAFKVRARNAVGSSTDSNIVTLTPVAAAVGSWAGKPAYLSYASSGPIIKNGESGFTISAKKFVSQVGQNVISVHLTNCSNFTITDLDFDGCTEPFEFENCTDFRISFCRSRNIIGPYQRDGSHRGNFYQFGNCFRYEIDHNKILGGNTEDVMSNFKSGGSDASHYSSIHDNEIDLLHNTQWTSNSGTGIILGDAQIGSYMDVYRNTLLSPGQVGIAIVGGVGHKVHDNTLYSAPRAGGLYSPNVGMASNYSSAITATVTNNRVYWRNNAGNQNPYWWGSGTITDGGGNDWHATTLDPTTIAVTL